MACTPPSLRLLQQRVSPGRTLLPPDIVEAIFGDGRTAKLLVKKLLRRFPVTGRNSGPVCWIRTNGLRPPRRRRMISE
jgi:hypothetical protein